MESPTLVDDFPKSAANGGFKTSPEREERSAWDQLASTHPHLVEELADRLPAWVTSRKRRGSRDRAEPDSQPDGRNRHLRDFLLDDFPAEFRQYIPSEWSQHFGSGNVESEPQPSPQANTSKQEHPTFQRQQSSEKSTQTVESGLEQNPGPNLNQYKLRNTVDLGQKTATELGQVDVEAARNQRSMSAPPDTTSVSGSHSTASAGTFVKMGNPQQPQQQHETQQPPQQQHEDSKQPNVRHIPIFVEGRDEPVINLHKDSSTNFAESRPTPPREEFFMDHDVPQNFHPTPHFSRAFGSPFKGFGNRNVGGFGSKMFGQAAEQPQQQKFKQQQQSNRPSQTHVNQPPQGVHPQPENVNSSHTQQGGKPPESQPSHPPQGKPQPEPQTNKSNSQHKDMDVPDGPESHHETQQQTHHVLGDPIEKIQLIQKDVLELMSQVETFKGKSKKEREYVYLDEMLTRNLIKLDDIETEGKENIRLARKEAIKCIQQCIVVLEAKAESNAKAEAQQHSVKTEQDNGDGVEKENNTNCNMDVDKCNENVKSEGTASENVSQEPKPMDVDANTSSQ